MTKKAVQGILLRRSDLRVNRAWSGVLDGSPTETVVMSRTISGNTLRVGSLIRFRGHIHCVTDAGVVDMRTKLRFGGTSAGTDGSIGFDSGALADPGDTVNFVLEAWANVRAVGTAGTIDCMGYMIGGVTGTSAAYRRVDFNTMTVDTTAEVPVKFTNTQSAGGNTVESDECIMEVKRVSTALTIA
jgi:hypothetical protein